MEGERREKEKKSELSLDTSTFRGHLKERGARKTYQEGAAGGSQLY